VCPATPGANAHGVRRTAVTSASGAPSRLAGRVQPVASICYRLAHLSPPGKGHVARARHRGQPGRHRAQRLRLHRQAERWPPQPLPDPGTPAAARTRPAGTHRRRNPGPPGGNRHPEPPPTRQDAAASPAASKSAGGQRRNLEWVPATWFSRTWATATARLTAGPARASGAMAAIMKTSPARRYSARHGCGRWAAAPRACPLRGRRTHGFAAPASDQVGGVIRATSGSVYKRVRMPEPRLRACPRRCRPGPSSSAGTTRRSPRPLRDLGDRLLPQPGRLNGTAAELRRPDSFLGAVRQTAGVTRKD
jgi:hypothetical protein